MTEFVYLCYVMGWDDVEKIYLVTTTDVKAQGESVRRRTDQSVREAGYYKVEVGGFVLPKNKSIVYTSGLGAG